MMFGRVALRGEQKRMRSAACLMMVSLRMSWVMGLFFGD